MKSIWPSVQSNWSGCPMLSSRKPEEEMKWHNDRMSWPGSHSFSWIDKVFTSAGKPPKQKILCRCQPPGFWKDFESVWHIHLFPKNMNKPCLCYLIGDGCRDNRVFCPDAVTWPLSPLPGCSVHCRYADHSTEVKLVGNKVQNLN